MSRIARARRLRARPERKRGGVTAWIAGTAIVCAAIVFLVLRFWTGLSQPVSYDWIAREMAQCEEEAVTRPDSLNFLVVPLVQTKKFSGEWKEKALSEAGGTTLFGSQDALRGLNEEVFRVSSRSYVMHTRDESNNMTHRWNSVSGVARLTSTEIPSDGPFVLRFQISPDDADPAWSTIMAEGRGTCHWAFALMRE